jgi:hypothetical protein
MERGAWSMERGVESGEWRAWRTWGGGAGSGERGVEWRAGSGPCGHAEQKNAPESWLLPFRGRGKVVLPFLTYRLVIMRTFLKKRAFELD